jgi:hypothetical protein
MTVNEHEIPLNVAVEMVTRFRKELKNIVQPDYAAALPFSETFNKSVFDTLNKVPGSVAIRAYLGLDDKKQVRLIFAAVNDKNEDILPDQGGALFEYGQRCPPTCPVGPLNPQVG